MSKTTTSINAVLNRQLREIEDMEQRHEKELQALLQSTTTAEKKDFAEEVFRETRSTEVIESDLPSLTDLAGAILALKKAGLSELPISFLVVPDSTLQSIARCLNQTTEPQTHVSIADDIAVFSVERLLDRGMSSTLN